MLNSFCLNTAGLNICIESEGLPITLQSDPAYIPFILYNYKNPCDIFIKVKNSPIPVINEAKKLFDNSESWSLYFYEQKYYMIFQPPVFDKPYLLAEINNEFSNATIFCSDFMLELKDGTQSIFNPVHYPFDQILLMHYLALREGAIIHSAGTVINGECFVFPGRSGAGKSTITRLCSKNNRFLFLSDDRIILRKISGNIQAFGTQWPGDEGIAVNNSSRLSGIFFIYHGNENRIEEISSQKAFEKILPVTSIPWYEKDSMSKLLHFCEELTSITPAYNLYFKADKNISDFLYDFIYRKT